MYVLSKNVTEFKLVQSPGKEGVNMKITYIDSTLQIFFSARVCKVTFKHLPQHLRRHMQSSGTLGQLLKNLPCRA